MERRRPRQHVRRLESGKKTMINEGLKYGSPVGPSRSERSIRQFEVGGNVILKTHKTRSVLTDQLKKISAENPTHFIAKMIDFNPNSEVAVVLVRLTVLGKNLDTAMIHARRVIGNKNSYGTGVAVMDVKNLAPL